MSGLDSLTSKFHKLDNLLGQCLSENNGFVNMNGILVRTVYSNGYSITISKWDKIIEYPFHYHDGYEILVCPKGSFQVTTQGNYPDKDIQVILSELGALFIPPKKPHKAINLISSAELIGVCVPPDSLYKELYNKVSPEI